MSLSEELFQLESAVRREKVSPEILVYEDQLISKILSDLDEKQEDLNSRPVESIDQHFEFQIYQLDLNRVKYLLSSYLRTRLFKIQNQAFYLVLNDQHQMLSNKEYEFLAKYYLLKTNHFKKAFLLKIPEELRRIDREEHSKSPDTMPNLEKYIFVKALEEIGMYHVPNGEDIEIHKDDIYLLPYSSAKPLILTNRLDVI
jgi:GINS complex subunit 4